MLIRRFARWFRPRETLPVFLLEILAIFVGITTSLVVDDWRQDRENAQRLDNILQSIHFNLILDRATNRAEFLLNSAAIDSGLALAYEDSSRFDDEELLRHFAVASPLPPQVTMPPGYHWLTTTETPFDRTLASIDGDFRDLEKAIATLNDAGLQIRELVTQLQRATGRPAEVRRVGLDGLSNTSASLVGELFTRLQNNPGYVADLDNAAVARRALDDPDLRALLVELVSRRVDAGVRLVQANARINSIIATIRTYAPDITLPVDSIGIDGDATGLGWSDTDGAEAASKTVPLFRMPSDPNVWTAVVVLVDGELKFRANDSWVINWGVPRTAGNLIGTGAQYVFGGNAEDYFPNGFAEIRGINIPVRAGRYRVTFNDQTFEYRFEPLLR